MKIAVSFIIAMLLISYMHGQNQANGKDIVNKLTKKHIRIPGTHVYLIPPKDFSLSQTFMGFTNSKNTSILVMDVFGSDFRVQSKDFNKATFEATGLKIYDYKEFKINGKQARYLYTNSLNSEDNNLMLAFGDSTFTVLLTVSLSVNDKKSFQKAEKCLLSIVYEGKVKIDPLETAKFTLDLSNTEFKFEKSESGLFFYKSNKSSSNDSDLPVFIISQMPYPEATDEILKLTTKQMIEKAREYGTDSLNLDFKKIEINGCQAIETTGFGIKNNQKILYYLLVVGKQNNVIAINSIIQSDFENKLKKITDLTHIIKLK
jgi:hypothetical protein